MKRSEINDIIRDADAFIRDCHFYLPPFANWTVTDWLAKGAEVSEIAEHGLGWDITDFGLGDFRSKGLTLFTIRNGSVQNLQSCTGKVYAEKLLIVADRQITPFHFHWQKIEDIINRGGGRAADPALQLDARRVRRPVSADHRQSGWRRHAA